jgi:drug/metabolite transporter (DMT)-like permease
MTRSALLRWCLLALVWGSSFLFMKVALEGISDRQIVVGRMTLGAGALMLIVAVRRERLPRELRIWGHLLYLTIIANLIPFFCFAWAEHGRVSSSLAGIYNAMTPLMTVLVAMVALPGERPTVQRISGVVLGFLGVGVILHPWTGLGGSSLTGQLACLLAATCYGVAITHMRRYISGSGYSPLAVSASQLSLGAGILLLMSPFVAATSVHLTWKVVAAILALGILGTGIAYVVNYGLIAEIGATRTSTMTYAMPVVAVILGVAILGEHVHWYHFVGAAIVITSVAVTDGRIRLPRRRAVVIEAA